MATLTWIGDTDPEAVSVTMEGLTFVKGEKVEVKDKDAFERLSKNPMFSADGKYDEPKADEPTEDELAARAEEGTEKATLKAKLREMGEDVKGNLGVPALRAKLAAATAKAN